MKHLLGVAVVMLLGARHAAADGTAWPAVDEHWAAACASFNQAFDAHATCTIDHKSFDSKPGAGETGDSCLDQLLRLTGAGAGRACAKDDACRAIVATNVQTISCKLDNVTKKSAVQTGSALTIRIPALPGDPMSQTETNFGTYLYTLDPDLFWTQQAPLNPDHTHDVCQNSAAMAYDRASIRVEDLVNSANTDAKTYCADFVIELQRLCTYHQAPQAKALTSIVCGEAKPGKPQSATLSGTTLRVEFRIVNGNVVPSEKADSARAVVDKAFGQ